MKPLPMVALLLFPALLVAADWQILDEEEIQDILTRSAAGYWGQAQLPGGNLILPEKEEDLSTPILPDQDSRRIIQDAVPAALGLWCGLDWQSYYTAYREVEQDRGWDDREMAFVEVLFGSALGNVRMKLVDDCDEKTRSLVRDTLTSSIEALRNPGD